MSRRAPRAVTCHKLVASTAISMAQELYETLMLDNLWYATWKARCPGLTGEALMKKFVELNTAGLVEQARATLAGMLSRPDINQTMKDEIYEALLLDNTLKGERANAPTLVAGLAE